MDEAYRTILGHFRHESGHYYWDRLVRDTEWLQPCRELFGDDRKDYAQALNEHYQNGPPADWREHVVSAYAYGLNIRPRAGNDDSLTVRHDFNAYREEDFDTLIEHWLPLTFALNSLNRSMGHEHAYPFVLAPAVIEKLRFIHRVVRK